MEFHIETPDPDEVRQMFAEQQDRMHMAMTSAVHDMQRFFNEMTEEQLSTLRLLLHNCGQHGAAAVFYEGIASAILWQKFGACGCGSKHDESALDALLQDESAAPPDVAPTSFEPPVEPDVTSFEPEAQVSTQPDATLGVNPPDRNLDLNETLRMMEAYRVEPKPDDVTGRMICMDCGQEYPSLEDRMLRPDCPTCTEKAKWG